MARIQSASCPSCGGPLIAECKFCPNCGTPILIGPDVDARVTHRQEFDVCAFCGKREAPTNLAMCLSCRQYFCERHIRFYKGEGANLRSHEHYCENCLPRCPECSQPMAVECTCTGCRKVVCSGCFNENAFCPACHRRALQEEARRQEEENRRKAQAAEEDRRRRAEAAAAERRRREQEAEETRRWEARKTRRGRAGGCLAICGLIAILVGLVGGVAISWAGQPMGLAIMLGGFFVGAALVGWGEHLVKH